MSWPTAPLGDVATIERRSVDPGALPGSARYIGLEHIERGGRIVGFQRVDEAQLASLKFAFDESHVLFGKLRPYLGKVARPDFAGVCSTDILPIRPGKHLHRGFLHHFLKQPSMVRFAAARATGANLPRLSPSTLATFEVPLPPVEEQHRIAGILDRAEVLRAKRQHALARLEDLPRYIFLEMFGDPVANVRGWPLKPFGEVCETRLGKMLDAKQQTGEHARPYLRNANVQWFRFDLRDVLSMDFDEKSRSILRLEPGDLLICEGGEPGRAAVWRGDIDECYFQKALHRARPNAALACSDFLAYVLWFLAKGGGLTDHITSATIAHLTGVKLGSMPVILPEISLQRLFVQRLAGVMRLREVMTRSAQAEEILFASLQDRAFTARL